MDHVADLQQSVDEIQRVIKPGGLLLLICDVNRKATITEPHSITPHLLKDYFQDMILQEEKLLMEGFKFRLYENVRANDPLKDTSDQGVLVA